MSSHAWAEARAADRLEDLHWMIDTGESLTGAATRLGLSPDSLERWCERRGLYAEVATLRSRNPIDPDRTPSELGRLASAARRAS